MTNIVHDPVGLSAYMDRTALNELLEYDNADNYYNALLADKELNLSEDSFAEVVSHENQEKAAEEMNTMMQTDDYDAYCGFLGDIYLSNVYAFENGS